MTLDDYNSKITAIFQELQSIADITKNQALTGSADFSNPQFRSIMERQSTIIAIAAELNNRMLAQVQNND